MSYIFLFVLFKNMDSLHKTVHSADTCSSMTLFPYKSWILKLHHPPVIYKTLYYLNYTPVILQFITFLGSNQYGDFRPRICWWIWILSFFSDYTFVVIHHHWNTGYNIQGLKQSLEVTNQIIGSCKLLSTFYLGN